MHLENDNNNNHSNGGAKFLLWQKALEILCAVELGTVKARRATKKSDTDRITKLFPLA
jgi:hypothetical protein